MRKIDNLNIKISVTLIYAGITAIRWFADLPSCVFKLITGLPCPFCGMTRAFVSALKSDLTAAFEYHFMVWSLPILYLLFLYDFKPFKSKGANITVWSVLGAGFLFNWIVHIISTLNGQNLL